MGDDNKMKGEKSSQNEKSLQTTNVFLPEDALKHEKRPAEYNLANELGKADKKKDVLFYLASIGFVVAVVAIAYLLTTYVVQKNRKVEVNIQEFDSFNLAELVQQARRDKDSLDQAQSEKAAIEKEQNSLMATVYSNAKSERELLNAQNLSAAEKAQKLEAINAAVEKEIASMKEEFSAKLEEKSKEINELQAKVEKQQSVLAKEGNAALTVDNSSSLTQIQLDKQKQSYEERIADMEKAQERRVQTMRSFYQKQSQSLIQKYNPAFKEKNLIAILAQQSPEPTASYQAAYSSALQVENIMTKTEYSELQKQIADRNTLVEALRKIPYTNSVPPSLQKIEQLNTSIDGQLQDMWAGLSIGVLKRDQIIDAYQYALNDYVAPLDETRGWLGYVLDARREQAVLLYLKSPEMAKDGDTVYVVDDEGKMLLKLALHPIQETAGRVESKGDITGKSRKAYKIRVLAEVVEGNTKNVKPFLRVSKTLPVQ